MRHKKHKAFHMLHAAEQC